MSPEESHTERISNEEKELLEALRQNPSLKKSMNGMLKRFNQEVGDGMDELEAELLITEMTQKIGSNLVQDWAEHTQEKAVSESLKNSNTIKRGKKNSTGIPPTGE